MSKHAKSIVVSLLLFIGLAVTGIAVQRSQDTRRKAVGTEEPITNEKCKLCKKPYVCDTSKFELGPRFLMDVENMEDIIMLEEGTTMVVDVGVDSKGKKVSGLDVVLDFDASVVKVINTESLVNDFVMYSNCDGGNFCRLSLIRKNVESSFDSTPVDNKKIARITFEVLSKSPNWLIKFQCTRDAMTDSNILTAEDGAVMDITECDQNEWFSVDEIGNKLINNPYECESALRQNDQKFLGDYNCDYTVNGADYIMWRQEFIDKNIENGIESDGNCDGKTSVSDYSLWRQNYISNID